MSEFHEGSVRGGKKTPTDGLRPTAPSPPMPKVKPPKSADVEDSALRSIMSLAIFGAGVKALQDGADQYKALSECMQLFKDAGFVK